MAKSNKRSRITRQNSGRAPPPPSIGRLSVLPDSILSNILSFLPTTKHVVATSVLSRRWRSLWTEVPSLNFHFTTTIANNRDPVESSNKKYVLRSREPLPIENSNTIRLSVAVVSSSEESDSGSDSSDLSFISSSDSEDESYDYRPRVHKGNSNDMPFAKNQSKSMPLSDIVNRVLLLHNSRCLNEFRLFSNEIPNANQFDAWMAAVVSRNVRVLNISLAYVIDYVKRSILLPHCIFTCNTIIDLKLCEHSITIPSNCAVSLPHLKKLHLSYVRYENDESLPRLLPGCLMLENLTMDRRLDDNMISCHISSSTLKSLKLNVFAAGGFRYNENYRLNLDTPDLRFLRVLDHTRQHVSTGSLPLLIEADIDLYHANMGDAIVEYCLSLIKFVKRLHKVKSLKFESHIKFHRFVNPTIFSFASRFSNLNKLDLAAHWCFLNDFLKFADNLEVLIIREVYLKLKCWREPDQIPECVLSRLRRVTIYAGGDTQDELKLVKYILQNAQVLTRMEIYGTYLGRRREISAFPRASETCELVFY